MALLKKIKQWILQLPIYGKFGRDVSWNIGSFIIISISGIVLNILIARVYGAAILGIFNQVYAVYILSSQFAVGGIHLSVQKYIAEFSDNRKICDQIISSALILSLLIGGLVCFIVFILHSWVGNVLKSSDVSLGLIYALPGLGFFALNKVLLSILNGYRLMKAYAIAMGFRYILMVGLLVISIIINLPGNRLPIIFSGSEIILLIGLIIYIFSFYSPVNPKELFDWFHTHLIFGLKAFGSGALLELNTRIDVLMLGYFTTDRIVGIYSLPAILIEGILQLVVVLKTNINPVLTFMFSRNQLQALKEIIRRGVKIFYLVMGVIGIVAMIVYPLIIHLFLPRDFFVSWQIFYILMLGVILSAGYMPFNMLFLQVGYPGLYTLMISLAVFANIILNGLLIPIIGMYGAAIATSISFMFSVFLLKIFSERKLKLQI